MAHVHMSRFPIHDEETAPAEAAPLLKIASAAGGQLPNFLGALSNSPATLRAFLRFRQELSRGRLDPQVRARIALAVGSRLRAERAGQEQGARAAGLGLDEIRRARRWDSQDAGVRALLRWLEPLVAGRGDVPDPLHEDAREAGWTDADLLEAIAVLALESLTAHVTVAGDVPDDGSSEQTRQLRAVA